MLHNLNNGLHNKLVLRGHKQKMKKQTKNINNKFVVIASVNDNQKLENEMIFCYQNCSDLQRKKCSIHLEKLLKFVANGREFAKKHIVN